MNSLFQQYSSVTAEKYSAIWKDALFVFDTNVLLNLYRYQKKTKRDLVKVIENLKGKRWIPHHVALEFQKNRLDVISSQIRQFSDVKNIIQKIQNNLVNDLGKLQLEKRHSLIDTSGLIGDIEKSISSFFRTLDAQEKNQQKLDDYDELKVIIENLFEGCVGLPPDNQKYIDDIYNEAQGRFEKEIPPGFLDKNKENSKKGPSHYMSGGILYRREFADFLIWKQILEHAKISHIKSLIFITDDAKDDWWLNIECNGTKRIGPRPELIDEACLVGGVEYFLMYNSERFLKYANEYLNIQLSDGTISEVRDVSQRNTSLNRNLFEIDKEAFAALYRWLDKVLGSNNVNFSRIPGVDLIVKRKDMRFGLQVKIIRDPRMIGFFEDINHAKYNYLPSGKLDIVLIAIVLSVEDAGKLEELLARRLDPDVSAIIGVYDLEGSGEFLPITKLGKSDGLF